MTPSDQRSIVRGRVNRYRPAEGNISDNIDNGSVNADKLTAKGRIIKTNAIVDVKDCFTIQIIEDLTIGDRHGSRIWIIVLNPKSATT